MTIPTKHTQPPGDVITAHVLRDLRALAPDRQLSHTERLRLAERQAAALRRLLDATSDRFPVVLVHSIPCIQVRAVADLPVSGLSFWGDHTWKIHVRAKESLIHRRFSVLHELKHIIDHPQRGCLYDERAYVALGERELIADHFAVCALLPAENLRAAAVAIHDRRELAQHFGVSGHQLALRMAELGIEPVATSNVIERRTP